MSTCAAILGEVGRDCGAGDGAHTSFDSLASTRAAILGEVGRDCGAGDGAHTSFDTRALTCAAMLGGGGRACGACYGLRVSINFDASRISQRVCGGVRVSEWAGGGCGVISRVRGGVRVRAGTVGCGARLEVSKWISGRLLIRQLLGSVVRVSKLVVGSVRIRNWSMLASESAGGVGSLTSFQEPARARRAFMAEVASKAQKLFALGAPDVFHISITVLATAQTLLIGVNFLLHRDLTQDRPKNPHRARYELNNIRKHMMTLPRIQHYLDWILACTHQSISRNRDGSVVICKPVYMPVAISKSVSEPTANPQSAKGVAEVAESGNGSAAMSLLINGSAAVSEPDCGSRTVSVPICGYTAVSESMGRPKADVGRDVEAKDGIMWISMEPGSVGRTQYSPKEPCFVLDVMDVLASDVTTNTSTRSRGELELNGGTRDHELWELYGETMHLTNDVTGAIARLLQCGNLVMAAGSGLETDGTGSVEDYDSDALDNFGLDSTATENSDSAAGYDSSDDGGSNWTVDDDSDSVTGHDWDSVDDGGSDGESGGNPDASVEDGSDVTTGNNSKVWSDGSSDGESGDDPGAEAGGNWDAATDELLRQWLECGHSDVAGFELFMRRLTSPEPLEWVASELLTRVLSCFALDTEAFRFLEEWLNSSESDAMACELLIRWINSAGLDTWEVPMPMQHLESDPIAFAVLKRWFSCFVSHREAFEVLMQFMNCADTDAMAFEVLVQLLNCAPSDGLAIKILIRLLYCGAPKAVAFEVLKRWLNSRVSSAMTFQVLMQWKPEKTAFEDLVQCLNSCDSEEAAFELSMCWLNCGEVIMGSGPGAAADDRP